METCCEYLSDRVMWVSTDEDKWKRRFLQWAEDYPDEVSVKRRPEENDGCLCVTCPAAWLRIRPPLKRNMTDDQRAAMADRMRKWRESQNEEQENDETEDDTEDA